MSNQGKTHTLTRLTVRQAAIRSAFICAYPSSVTLVEILAPDRKYFDIIVALISGVTYRRVAYQYAISINAIYTREVRFYRLAEKYLVRNVERVKMYPKTKKYVTAPILSLPIGTQTVKHNN